MVTRNHSTSFNVPQRESNPHPFFKNRKKNLL